MGEVSFIDGREVTFGMGMTVEGYVVLTWRSDDGCESVELDPQSPDVKETLDKIRYIIWG